jgi:hypothetical protein
MQHISAAAQKFITHPAVIVSCAYSLAYLITVMFLSSAIVGGSGPTASASLIFLPHGVRIIAAWLYGWRAVFYILPGAYITHLARLQEASSVSLSDFLGPAFGVLCASFCFSVIARMGHDLRFGSGNPINWQDIILVGALASVINSAGTNLVYGNSLHITAGYFVGDILGMITVMFILMLSFRLHRKYS